MKDVNRARARRVRLGYTFLPLSLAAAAVMAILIGASLSLPDMLRQLFHPEDMSQATRTILLQVRLPRVLMAMLVGGALSVCGVVMQGMFLNPLADPHILGISSGASVGAIVAIGLGLGGSVLGQAPVTLLAFVGGVGTMFVVYLLSMRRGRSQTGTLLLAGVAMGSLLSAVSTLLLRLNYDKMDNILFWSMGSLATAGWRQVGWTLPFCLLGMGASLFYSRDLNLLSQGEEAATLLGVDVGRTRAGLMVVTALTTAGAVAATGTIGFIGLIVPHSMRAIFGPDHRHLMPLSALGGALLLVVVDTLARSVAAPLEIPVGALTALLGAPFFIYLLRRQYKGR